MQGINSCEDQGQEFLFPSTNRSPILWSSKKQRSIETSSFGSEFMALKTAMEIICSLRYKVRMMGIPIDEVTHIMVDNMSMVYNTTRPESTLKKKSKSIAYHFIRESAVAKEIKIQHVGTKVNMSDMLLKKPFPSCTATCDVMDMSQWVLPWLPAVSS